MPQPESLARATCDAFLANAAPATPCLVIDLDVVRARYQALRALLPDVTIYYAVKANPAPEIIAALAELDCCFDLASPGEMELCAGMNAARLSHGNTVKRERDVAATFRAGIDLFAFDSEPELKKLAQAAPGARVFCRIVVRNAGAEWPLTHKFGCDPRTAIDLLVKARAIGLRPAGVSFHVGSQQTDPRQWETPIAHAAEIFHACARHGVALSSLNLGGGLPARYRTEVPDLERYMRSDLWRVGTPLRLLAPCHAHRTWALPDRRRGCTARRSYAGGGTFPGPSLGSTSMPAVTTDFPRFWVSAFSIASVRLVTGTRPDQWCSPVRPATAPDILYERARYELPLSLTAGDHVDFLSAGAYTASYASVGFNGFAPVRTWCV